MRFKNLGALLLLPFLLHAIPLNRLANSRYWKILLHYRNGRSEIDSPNFFLSKNGKYSPLDELNATVYYLLHPKYKGDKSVYCRFPARRVWIEKMLPNLKIKKQTCPQLQKALNALKDVSSVSVIFPTISMNSPASMFGHTLIRLNYPGDPLNSFAVNFAAQTTDTNGIIYAFKGLTGLYHGKYAILPYYKKIFEYNDIKNRDIWEYKLNLTKQEIHRLVLHIYEIKNTYSKYYYFNKNCSYEILWLLEAARPKLNLVNRFHYKVLPIDTLKVMKQEGLIVSSKYRPSKQKIILNYYNRIKHKKIALLFSKTHNLSLIKNFSKKEKQYILDFAIEMLNYEHLGGKIDRKNYLKQYIALLKVRSKLGKEKTPKIKPPQNPLFSQDSNKIWIYGAKNEVIMGYKPAFHNIDDMNTGFTPGAYIDFFPIEFQISDKNAKLLDFYFFDIKSLSPRNDVFKPVSWSVKLGLERFKNDKLYATLQTGAYFTYSALKGNFLYAFGIIVPQYLKDSYYIGISPAFYAEYNFKKAKFFIETRKNYFKFKKYFSVYSQLLFQIKRDFNVNIGYKKTINDNYFFAGFSVYWL